MKKHKRLLSCMIAVCMLFTLCGTAVAEQSELMPESIDQAPSDAVKSAERVRELSELRESNSKTFLLEDGQYQAEIYADDIHYLVGDHYEDIDNSIVREEAAVKGSNYAYKNGANSFDIRFSESTKGYTVLLEKDGKSISFGFSGAKEAFAEIQSKSVSKVLTEYVHPNNSVAYKNVADNIDLIYSSATHGVREFIVLNKPTAQNEFYFDMQLDGLTPKIEKNRIAFVDDSGETVFVTNDLFAIDSANGYTDAIKCELTAAGQLKLTVDKAWLTSEDRVWPVAVDPTIHASYAYGDAFICASGASTPHNGDYLRTGTTQTYGVCRSFVRFNLPTGIYWDDVIEANLVLTKRSGTIPQIYACRVKGNWFESNITWNYHPQIATNSPTSTAVSNSANQYAIDVKYLVRMWLKETYANYGFCVLDIIEGDESRATTFYSSEYSTVSYRPMLSIKYYDYVELSVPLYHQEKDNWCWAAAAYMAAKYKVPSSPATQSSIVEYIKGDSTNNQAGTTAEVSAATAYATLFQYETGYSLVTPSPYNSIKTSINNDYPIAPLVLSPPVGHYYVIIGYNSQYNRIVLNDPNYYNEQRCSCSWEDFSTGNTSGGWIDTRPHHSTVFFRA